MGIALYGRERGWLLEEMPAHVDSIERVMASAPDGLIAHVLDEPLGHVLENCGIPAVNLSSNQETLTLPTIDADQTAVGEMAAKYFWELGYRNYAFFGSASAAFSRQREAAFRQWLSDKEIRFSATHIDYTLRPPFEHRMQQAEQSISEWLVTLVKPVAIFCSNDEHARLLSSLCQVSGVRVADEVALLGVDNDETMCLLSSPPLSSIDNPGEEIGYRAAAMLDNMITNGIRKLPSERILPIRIIERASTERFAAQDTVAQKAITFINRNLRNPNLSVDAVAEHVNVSRRSLERTFEKRLGLTVLTVTQRARIRKAKSLLRESDLPVQVIAAECGFSNHRRFGIVFRAFTEMTPSEFRNFYEFDKR